MRRPVAALAVALLPWQATAQERNNVLEEVLVTAQHRTESAQETPISLFTMNTEQLEKQRITSLTNLNGLVPNLNIDGFPANNQTLRLFIRGVGLTDTQITQDAAVGVYLDGAYIARSTGLAFDVADLARIEVLRGPQGTLYGRNTTAGAIKLITKRPDVDNFSFEQTLGGGNNDLFSSKTSVNVPFSEKYAAKVAYFYEDVEGFTNNDGPGGGWGDRKSEGFRFDFRADLTDTLTADYSYDRSEIEYHNLPAQAVSPRESGGTDLLAIIGDIVQDYITYDNNRLNTLSSSVPLLPTDTIIDGHTLNVDWVAGDNVTIRSITAYREVSDKSYLDFASGSTEDFRVDFYQSTIGANAGDARIDVPTVRPDLEQEQFSQEFQFIGTVGESLEYLAGAYYFTEEAEEDILPVRHIFSAFPFGARQGTIYNIGSEYNSIDNEAWAVFTQWTWTPDILDQRLHLTAGWRHSEDSRDAEREVVDQVVVDNDTSILPLIDTFFSAKAGNDWDDDSFTFIVEYDWSDEMNVYAKYAEAYKSGGFNIRDSEEAQFSEGFDPETLAAWEAGFKGELLQRMVRVNAAVFYQEFDDFQYNFQIPGTIQNTRVFNVDEGEMRGVELEVMAMPTTELFLQLSYAYLDSELDDIISPFTGELEQFEFTNAPKHTYSFVADYTPSISPFGGVLNINASYNFVGDRQRDSETLYRDDYDLINARISLSEIEGLGGQWTVAAWGKNLQDSDYESFTLDNLPQADRAVIWGNGRSYGVDVTYRFE